LDLIGEDLMRQGIVSAFAITPVESVELAAVMLGAGFRRTGRMIGHMVVAGERVDACVWSRRLAEPA
jgi:RimJ/RimL family protein N-acetyltransferase